MNNSRTTNTAKPDSPLKCESRRFFLSARITAALLSGVLAAGLTACGSVSNINKTDKATESASYTEVSSEINDTILTVNCFDVGKGDAFLLTTKNSAVMIDTGYKENGKDLAEAVKASGHDHLDILIISHFDKDHVGGASKVLKNIPIDRVLTTRVTNDNKRTTKFLEELKEQNKTNEVVSADTEIRLDNVTYTISAPERSSYGESEDNNSSLLVKATLGDTSMLFTGDAEDPRLSEIIKKTDLTSTVLKLPHHGSYFLLLPDLIEKVNPRYAVITSSYDKPEDEATNTLLKSKGITPYYTKEGDITITLTGEEIGVSQTHEKAA